MVLDCGRGKSEGDFQLFQVSCSYRSRQCGFLPIVFYSPHGKNPSNPVSVHLPGHYHRLHQCCAAPISKLSGRWL